MNSPFTGKVLKNCVENREIQYKGNTYQIQYYFLLCEETKEEFTTTELDEINLKNLHSVAEKKCKRVKMSDLFKNGDDFQFSNFDYGSKEGCKIVEELKKQRKKIHDSATYRAPGWRDWKFGR